MSYLKPARGSVACGAPMDFVRIPWENGRRTNVREKVRVYCDLPYWHVDEGSPHFDKETKEKWRKRFSDCYDEEVVTMEVGRTR